MAVVVLEIPRKLLKNLKRKAESEGKTLEELAGSAILSYYGIDDPEIKAELHSRLCEKYLKDGKELLAKGDYAQASEKLWGAAAQIVKALAAAEGREIRSHADLHRYIVEVAKRTGDDEVRALWQSALALHQNFYENWLPAEMVEANARDVEKLIEKLRKLLEARAEA